ncbi:MAG: exonuclease SbcCD subunit D [Sulfurihydrogenibium sp.]|jgi:DNA repair exonuclease SbcCD nuclease subunit|nr:exonuclease SbcCD subunit D [Sulfurihydrogenibium sp.]
MRFLHISDTHLGYQQYNIKDRERDYFDVFQEAIDKAIEKNVDFIIHTGDFFHSSRPSNESILDGLYLIKKLKDHKIPMFVIPGNHDRGSGTRDRNALEILSEFGLRLLDSDFVEYNGVNIFGLKYISPIHFKRSIVLKDILYDLYEKATDKNNFNILMLHLEFWPAFSSSELQTISDVPFEYDYVGIGHYHQRQEPIKEEGRYVVYPGSTEYTQFNEKSYIEKGCYLVEVGGKNIEKIEFIPLNARKFLGYNIDYPEIDKFLEDIEKDLNSLNLNKKPILSLKINTQENISNKDILRILESKNLAKEFLYIKIEVKQNKRDILDDTTSSNTESFSAIEKLKEVVDDEELRIKLEEIFKMVESYENVKELEEFIKQHPEMFEI